MIKRNNKNIHEHYDLKFNRDKQAFISLSAFLSLSIFLLIIYFYTNKACILNNDINKYLCILSLLFIFTSLLVSIGMAYNNKID
jgi:hypothetical protein